MFRFLVQPELRLALMAIRIYCETGDFGENIVSAARHLEGMFDCEFASISSIAMSTILTELYLVRSYVGLDKSATEVTGLLDILIGSFTEFQDAYFVVPLNQTK